jgi:hypothetical protein
MQFIPFIAISLHVLAGVFWAGSSFTLARVGAGAELYQRLWRPQIGAALVAFLTGGYLGHTFHRGAMSAVEQTLFFGVGAATLALVLQIGARVVARRAQGGAKFAGLAQRAAALLLILTVIGMAGARYAEPVQQALSAGAA